MATPFADTKGVGLGLIFEYPRAIEYAESRNQVVWLIRLDSDRPSPTAAGTATGNEQRR